MLCGLGINLGQNILHEFHRVSLPDLPTLDMLSIVFLRVFKHRRNCIQACLKKHGQLQAFDDVWKTLLPSPGFFIPKKGYHNVAQWQGNEIRNLACCILGVLRVALRQR